MSRTRQQGSKATRQQGTASSSALRGSVASSLPSVVFQECPNCECLVPLLDYAEIRLPQRTVHMLYCAHCAVGYYQSVGHGGQSMLFQVRRSSKYFRKFRRAMKEAGAVKSAAQLAAALAA